MKTVCLYTLTGIILAFVAFAPLARASTGCDNFFAAGPINKRVRICISNEGNVVGFAYHARLTSSETWQSIDNIRVGVIGEGYALCDLDSNTASFDAAFDEHGWGRPWSNSRMVPTHYRSRSGARRVTAGLN